MITLLQIEIEHNDGEILSACISNNTTPVFHINLDTYTIDALNDWTTYIKLSDYLQEKEKEESKNSKIP